MTKVINLRKIKKQNFKLHNNNSKKSINKSYLKNDMYKIIFTIVAIVSIVLGCFIYKNYQIDIISDLSINIINQIQSKSFILILLSYLKFDILYFTLLFFFGSSLLGAPLTFIPIILKSVFIGYMSSFIYNEYSLKGTLFCIVLLFPIYTITTTSLIYAANESVYMSKSIFSLIKNINTANNISARLYLIRYGFLFIINFLSILIISLLAIVIANKFTLF